MSVLSNFFKESHRALGVFYPVHCLVAVFGDLKVAERVRNNLLAAGFAHDEVIAVEGRDLIELENEETGMASVLMQHLSRGLVTEQISTDHNLYFAEKGGGLVFVHCPSELLRKRAWDVMQPETPLAAHYYGRFAVEHLVCRVGAL